MRKQGYLKRNGAIEIPGLVNPWILAHIMRVHARFKGWTEDGAPGTGPGRDRIRGSSL